MTEPLTVKEAASELQQLFTWAASATATANAWPTTSEIAAIIARVRTSDEGAPDRRTTEGRDALLQMERAFALEEAAKVADGYNTWKFGAATVAVAEAIAEKIRALAARVQPAAASLSNATLASTWAVLSEARTKLNMAENSALQMLFAEAGRLVRAQPAAAPAEPAQCRTWPCPYCGQPGPFACCGGCYCTCRCPANVAKSIAAALAAPERDGEPDGWLVEQKVNGEWRPSGRPHTEPPPPLWSNGEDWRIVPLFRHPPADTDGERVRALEEAARLVENYPVNPLGLCDRLATQIRALAASEPSTETDDGTD